MTERQTRHTNSDEVATPFRSSLLMPIMEGNTLEQDDVSDFLAGRLSNPEDRNDLVRAQHLS